MSVLTLRSLPCHGMTAKARIVPNKQSEAETPTSNDKGRQTFAGHSVGRQCLSYQGLGLVINIALGRKTQRLFHRGDCQCLA